jgi:DNA-binding FadR family transcriptional regulator
VKVLAGNGLLEGRTGAGTRVRPRESWNARPRRPARGNRRITMTSVTSDVRLDTDGQVAVITLDRAAKLRWLRQ